MDVKLTQTNDGGEIEATNGEVVLDYGLATAVYLSLFGGNADDSGETDTTRQWWGNINESVLFRSQTQHLISSTPMASANFARLVEAAKSDLKWLLDVGAASSIDVTVKASGLNRVQITATLDGDNSLTYSENWRAAAPLN